MSCLRPLLVELVFRAIHHALPILLRRTLLGCSAASLRYRCHLRPCLGVYFLSLLDTAVPQFAVMLALLDLSCLHDKRRVDSTAVFDRGLITALLELFYACSLV